MPRIYTADGRSPASPPDIAKADGAGQEAAAESISIFILEMEREEERSYIVRPALRKTTGTRHTVSMCIARMLLVWKWLRAETLSISWLFLATWEEAKKGTRTGRKGEEETT